MTLTSQQPLLRRPLESRRAVWIELLVVFVVVVAPLIFSSNVYFFEARRSDPAHGFVLQSIYRLVQAAGTVALILFVIHKSGRSRRRFGIFRVRIFRDTLAGFALFVGSMIAYYLLWYVAWAVMQSTAGSSPARADTSMISGPASRWQFLLLIAMSFANGAAEEISMRAYLITRLEELLGTRPALILSMLAFASYHTYQGVTGALSAALIGTIYGLYFLRFRRLWPLILAHCIQDIISIAMVSGRG